MAISNEQVGGVTWAWRQGELWAQTQTTCWNSSHVLNYNKLLILNHPSQLSHRKGMSSTYLTSSVFCGAAPACICCGHENMHPFCFVCTGNQVGALVKRGSEFVYARQAGRAKQAELPTNTWCSRKPIKWPTLGEDRASALRRGRRRKWRLNSLYTINILYSHQDGNITDDKVVLISTLIPKMVGHHVTHKQNVIIHLSFLT